MPRDFASPQRLSYGALALDDKPAGHTSIQAPTPELGSPQLPRLVYRNSNWGGRSGLFSTRM